MVEIILTILTILIVIGVVVAFASNTMGQVCILFAVLAAISVAFPPVGAMLGLTLIACFIYFGITADDLESRFYGYVWLIGMSAASIDIVKKYPSETAITVAMIIFSIVAYKKFRVRTA